MREGVPADVVYQTLSDERMPDREPVYFRVIPRESRALYRKHNSARNRRLAREFFAENEQWFRKAEAKFGVPWSIVLALLQIETSCGKHTGRERVFYRLARLASVAEPGNIQENVAQQSRERTGASEVQISARANVLQSMFLPQLKETIRVAQEMGIEPLELRGSSGGAIGIPQFLPGNIVRYGADADGDGKVNIYTAPDAIFSTARFLSVSGWPSGARGGATAQRKALLQYNRSDAYVDTALAMSKYLKSEIAGGPLPPEARNASRKGSKTKASKRKSGSHARGQSHKRQRA